MLLPRPPQKPLSHARGSQGFTLIEVLLAITILGMITTVIWGSFSRSLEAKAYIERVQERYHTVREAMRRIAEDLSQSFLTFNFGPYFQTTEAVEKPTIFQGGKDFLNITAFAHVRLFKDVAESDQCEISYFLEEDPEDSDKQNLLRRESRRLDGNPLEGGTIFVLAEDVVDIRFEYWEKNTQEWVEEWDSAAETHLNRLPDRVRYWLTIMDERGKELTFMSQTRLPIQEPLRTM